MKSGKNILIAALAVATSPLLLAAQAPPQGPAGGPGPRPDQPQMRQGFGPGAGRHMRGGRKHFGQRGMRMQRRAGLGRMLQNSALRERLGVTPEQAAKIRAQESGFAKAQIQNQANLRVKRMELAEMMAAEKPDRVQIDKKMREMNEASFAAQKSGLDHRLAMREMLTPEQKETMQKWQHEQRQQRMERGFGPRRGPGPRGPRPPMEPSARPPAE